MGSVPSVLSAASGAPGAIGLSALSETALEREVKSTFLLLLQSSCALIELFLAALVALDGVAVADAVAVVGAAAVVEEENYTIKYCIYLLCISRGDGFHKTDF